MSQINILFAFFCAVISSIRCETPCGFQERTTSFLETAVDFIEKARESIPSVSSEEKCPCPAKPMDCEELLQCGHNISGVYNIWPRNRIIEGKVEVYCDMTTDGGGWTLIQRRGDFKRPRDYFFKDWESYKRGFGDVAKDFWLGNDNIFAISNQRKYSIRFDLRDVEGNARYALYDQFWIENEELKYRLYIQDYSGDVNDSMIQWHHNQKFSTKDNDNDNNDAHCAQMYKGAWWYNNCHASNLNGHYYRGKHDSYADGVVWYGWKGHHESLDTTEMKIRPKNFRISSVIENCIS
uniref:U49-Liphistoxin-Lsp1a_1 n=1 Tax=Liphistius sp. SGP-2016 TaxID=1905180 RepID=A0A4Q8K2K2_9ARAC